MVGRVLTHNGITRCEKGSYALVGGEELSDAEREELLQLCRWSVNVRLRPRCAQRSDPDLQSLGDCSWGELTVIECVPMRQ
ncbi:MAG: hypothetical protein ACKOPS_23545 [Cyanobium sp.]